jgi:DNA polymerase
MPENRARRLSRQHLQSILRHHGAAFTGANGTISPGRHWTRMDDVPDIHSLTTLRDAEAACTRCPLYRNATQVVPGEGPKHAQVMLVGEQPGDQEDRQGHPFVGPAGRVLDRAIADAGIDRKEVFVTNAVKHFKFEPRGKRRLHKRPNAGEVDACRWWLDRERKIIKPRVIVALGATAARGLLGRTVTISSVRGDVLDAADDDSRVIVTIHPSYLLRLRDDASKEREYKGFVDDLRQCERLLKS